MHRLSDQPELDHRAVVLDETRIGSPAGRRKHRLPAGYSLDRPAQDLNKALIAREKNRAWPAAPCKVEIDPLVAARPKLAAASSAVKSVVDFGLNGFGSPHIVESDIK